MEQETDIEEKEISSEKFWFVVLGILGVPWLSVFVPQWLMWGFLWEFFGFFAALFGILGSLVWLSCAAASRSKRMLIVAVSISVISVAALAGVPNQLKLRVTLAANEGRYLKTIDEVRKSPDTWNDAHANARVRIDQTGGTLRVGFDMGNGMIDDFWYIVHDPSGEIMKVNVPGTNEKDPFEGVVGSARHLRGPWYFAIFYPDDPTR